LLHELMGRFDVLRRRLTYRVVATALGLLLALVAVVAQFVGNGGSMVLLADASLFIASAALLSTGLGVSTSIIEILWGVFATYLGIQLQSPLDVLGSIGSVFLLFILGLDMRMEVTLHLARRYAWSAIMTYEVTFLGVFLITYHIEGVMIDALSVALILSAGNAVMTYSLVKALGLDRARVGNSVVIPTLIMQFASIMAFVALVGGVTRTILVYLLMAVLALVVLPKVARYVIVSLPTRRETEAELRIVIASLLILALLSQELGVSASIIAFILGLALSESVRTAEAVENKLRGLTNGFLAPIFFFVVGLRFVPPSTPAAYLAIPLLAGALWVSKVELFRKFLALTGGLRISRKLAMTTLPNISVAALIAEMGLTSGVLSEVAYAVVITTALLMSVIAAAVLRAPPAEP